MYPYNFRNEQVAVHLTIVVLPSHRKLPVFNMN